MCVCMRKGAPMEGRGAAAWKNGWMELGWWPPALLLLLCFLP